MNLEAGRLPSQLGVIHNNTRGISEMKLHYYREHQRPKTGGSLIEGAIHFVDKAGRILFQFFPVQTTLQLQPAGIGGNTFSHQSLDTNCLFARPRNKNQIAPRGDTRYEAKNDAARKHAENNGGRNLAKRRRKLHWPRLLGGH